MIAMTRTPSPSSVVTSFIRWLRLKNYQYEVTFALYMLTPAEKFIFNSLVLSLLSMSLMAAYVYLPDHIASIYGHIHYYLTADVSLIKDYIPAAANSILRNTATSSAIEIVYETAKGATATTVETLAEL